VNPFPSTNQETEAAQNPRPGCFVEGVRVESQHCVVSQDPTRHLAFPDACRLASGEVVVVYRDGRKHVDPYGRIMLCRCHNPLTSLRWGSSAVVCDTDLDDRDPSIVQLADGTILINFFRLDYAKGIINLSVIRSTDNGQTWGGVQDISLPGFFEGLATSDAIVELPSGDLILPVYGKRDDGQCGSYLVRSQDGGATWPIVTPISNTQSPIFEEPSIVALPDQRLIAFFRTDNGGLGYLFISESVDEGWTWSEPQRLDLWGYPADLLALKNGGVLATYGYRQLPAGIRYCLSPTGHSWSIFHEKILRADGDDGGELGYPSSVELTPGGILTVYYFTDRAGGYPYIAATRYPLNSGGSYES